MDNIKTVVRVNGANPNHHIWNNNGVWWTHYTEHFPDYTKRRVRESLHTADLAEARRRRDELFRKLGVELPGSADVRALAA